MTNLPRPVSFPDLWEWTNRELKRCCDEDKFIPARDTQRGRVFGPRVRLDT